MQKNPCSGLDVNPLHPSMTLQDYQDAVSLEDGLYPIEGNSADYTYIDADAIGYKTTSVGDALKYSTTEHIVGEWIDGTPVYEKTVNFGAMPNNTTKYVAHGISNLGYIISADAFMSKADYSAQYSIPVVNASTLSGQVSFAVTSSNLSITTKQDQSSFAVCYVTLRYTKTS